MKMTPVTKRKENNIEMRKKKKKTQKKQK